MFFYYECNETKHRSSLKIHYLQVGLSSIRSKLDKLTSKKQAHLSNINTHYAYLKCVNRLSFLGVATELIILFSHNSESTKSYKESTNSLLSTCSLLGNNIYRFFCFCFCFTYVRLVLLIFLRM
jgi:hypothetical protein